MSVCKVDSQKFTTEIASSNKEFILVNFSAEWCSPCKKIEPKLKQLAQSYTEVSFLKVDADESPDLMDKYGVESIPTFMLFKRGDYSPSKVILGARIAKVEEELKALPSVLCRE